MKREKLVNGQIHHIFTKSIAGYVIFNTIFDYERFIFSLKYYQKDRKVSFSTYLKSFKSPNSIVPKIQNLYNDSNGNILNIIAYCIMPTHIHLILKQLKENKITIFMNNILNSYSRYFNLKIKRKGPLWEGRFKNVLVESDEQLLHLTRYIHLNPVTAYLVEKPELWKHSSYQEYLCKIDRKKSLCDFENIIDIKPMEYKKFVDDNISLQRELSKVKNLIME